MLSDNDFSGYFAALLAGSAPPAKQLAIRKAGHTTTILLITRTRPATSEPNRRMTDAADNQHSETRRLSDRDDCGEQKARRALSLRRTPRASEPSGSRWATPRGPENGAGPCDPGSGGDRGERGGQCGRRPKGPLSRARVCVGGGGLPKSRVKPANLRWRPWMFLSSGRLLFVCLSRTGRLPSAICNAGRPPRRDARRVHPAI